MSKIQVNSRVSFNYAATENNPAMLRTGIVTAIIHNAIVIKQDDATHRRFRLDRIIGDINVIN